LVNGVLEVGFGAVIVADRWTPLAAGVAAVSPSGAVPYLAVRHRTCVRLPDPPPCRLLGQSGGLLIRGHERVAMSKATKVVVGTIAVSALLALALVVNAALAT